VLTAGVTHHMATVAHILPFPTIGGTEHATLRIARAVDAARFRSVAFTSAGADQVQMFFADAGIEAVKYSAPVHSYRRAAAFLRDSARLAAQFRTHRVDLVHCADLLGAYHAALAGRLAGVPVICHIRNRFAFISRRDRSFLWPVRRFVFVSRDTWTHFGHPVPPQRGVVVYDGIRTPATATHEEDRRSVRQEFGLGPDEPLIGMMARVAPQKDFSTLARAARIVLGHEPRARFLIAGDYDSAPNYRTHYQQVQAEMEACGVRQAFIFTGQRSDVPRLLSSLDVFVLSTHWEGLPLVILEAMAFGVPVVATAVDGVPEVVHHGETGLLVRHEDPDELASSIRELLADRRRAAELGAGGRTLVQDRFTETQFAAAMNVVYAMTLDESRTVRAQTA
jgi:glycosyltransferase involved in cell wall biosynthesis